LTGWGAINFSRSDLSPSFFIFLHHTEVAYVSLELCIGFFTGYNGTRGIFCTHKCAGNVVGKNTYYGEASVAFFMIVHWIDILICIVRIGILQGALGQQFVPISFCSKIGLNISTLSHTASNANLYLAIGVLAGNFCPGDNPMRCEILSFKRPKKGMKNVEELNCRMLISNKRARLQ